MKSIHLKGTMGRFFLGFALLFGIGIMSSITAQAQWQNNPYGQDRATYERQQRQRERAIRREQQRREREAARNNRGYDNRGYDNRGYNDDWNRRNNRGYDGYGNYGGSTHFRTTALNAGANEGIKEGRRDRERGERFDYTDESAYREATKDYSSRIGDRNAYQRYFREAFVTGYTEGYRGY